MKILFISDTFHPEVAATASQVYERAKYWVKWGCDVTVLTCAPNFPHGKLYPGYKNKWYQEEMIDGIRVVRVKTFMSENSGSFLRILDFISFAASAAFFGTFLSRHDIVVAVTPQFFCAMSGYFLSKLKRVPFVLELCDIWPASIRAVGAMNLSLTYRLLEKIELYLYRKATSVVAVTPAFKQNLIDRNIDANKIHVVVNGVELSQFCYQEPNSNLIKALDLSGKFVIGYIGTHGMAHNLQNVIEAASLLKNCETIHFLFVGDGAERQQLIQKAEALGCRNITFIASQPKDKMKEYWSICSVALIHLKNDPVFAEVIPSKIFEAMAMGLPILITAPTGQATSIVEEAKVGLSVTPNDPQALAQAIKALQLDKDALKRYSENSLCSAQNHSREKQARELLTAIEDSISLKKVLVS